MELNTERIEAAIVAEVSDKIIGTDEIYSRAKTAIEQRVDALWRNTIKGDTPLELFRASSGGTGE